MELADWYIEHAVAWSLVLLRMLGLFLFTPLLSSSAVPARARAAIAVAAAAAVYLTLPDEAREPPAMTLVGLGWAAMAEVLIGIAVGMIASLPVVAIEMAGHLIAYQMGFGLANVINPDLDTNLNSIGSLLFYIAIGSFLLVMGPEIALLSVADTFGRIPVGGFAGGDPAVTPVPLLLAVLTAGTELALRISMPVMASALLILIAMGFLMKTMPQLNIMSVGFALKIMAGMLLLVFGIFTVGEEIGAFVGGTVAEIAIWVRGLAEAGGGGAADG